MKIWTKPLNSFGFILSFHELLEVSKW